MKIKVQLEKNIKRDEIISETNITLVSDDTSDLIIGEIISYDTKTGVAICELYDVKEEEEKKVKSKRKYTKRNSL